MVLQVQPLPDSFNIDAANLESARAGAAAEFERGFPLLQPASLALQ